MDAGALTVRAGAADNPIDMQASAETANIGASFAAASGLEADAKTDGTVEAFIGTPLGQPSAPAPGRTINVADAVMVGAYTALKAKAFDGGEGSFGFDISVLEAAAETGGVTRAFVGEAAHVTAGSVGVRADAGLDLHAAQER